MASFGLGLLVDFLVAEVRWLLNPDENNDDMLHRWLLLLLLLRDLGVRGILRAVAVLLDVRVMVWWCGGVVVWWCVVDR